MGWDIIIVDPPEPKSKDAKKLLESGDAKIKGRWLKIVFRFDGEDDGEEFVAATALDDEEAIDRLAELMTKYGEHGEELPSLNGTTRRTRRGGPYMARITVKHLAPRLSPKGRKTKKLYRTTSSRTIGPIEVDHRWTKTMTGKQIDNVKPVILAYIEREFGLKLTNLPQGTEVWAV